MLKRGVWIILFVLLSSSVLALRGDFDDNGCVNLEDFFLFVDNFQKEVNKDNEKFDLDGNKKIDVEDFFIFAEDWDKCGEDENLLIDLGSEHETFNFLKKDSTAFILGVPVTLNEIDLSERKYNLSIDNKSFDNLEIGRKIQLEDFTITIEDFFETEMYYRLRINNPLIKTFDSLGVEYDFYGGILGSSTLVVNRRGEIIKDDSEHFPQLNDFYKYKNIFWIVSEKDLFDEQELKKFALYLEHGGNLFIFFERALPMSNEDWKKLSFLPDVSFSDNRGKIFSIIPGGQIDLVRGLYLLEFSKGEGLEIVAFGVGPFDLSREQYDNLSKEELYSGEVLRADYFGSLVYADMFGGSKVLISSLNFDRRIPLDFSKQLFKNIFEWTKSPIEICSDHIDNNGNKLVDCNDIGCFASDQCKSCIEKGLFENDCSLFSTPMMCQNLTMVPNCQKCGCLGGLACREDGQCERISPGPVFKNFTFRNNYFINEFASDIFLRFEVIEPDKLNNEKGIAVLRDEQGHLKKLSNDIYCNKENLFSSVYVCSLVIERDTISKSGKYSMKISLTNKDGVAAVSEWFDFEVLDLPKCQAINDAIGVKPEKNAVKVAFYADNYEDFDSFKNRVTNITSKMFKKHEIYNSYKDKFDFYVSEYLEKNNCETYVNRDTYLRCNDLFNSLFYSRSCKEDVGVVFSKRDFRSNSAIHLSVPPDNIYVFGSEVEKVLAHELGHNPIGLGDAYCENKRYTTPTPYPNTFETLKKCEEYSKTHLGSRDCVQICEGDSDYNIEQGGYKMNHTGPIMMIYGGDFNLVEQMRVNWFFDCCSPNSCSELPKYCFSNICGSCPSKEYDLDESALPPCAEVVCKAAKTDEDIDEDGSPRKLDCGINDYAVHPGKPVVPFIDVENRLSESCAKTDYNCDGNIEEQCHFTPECPDLYRSKCMNDREYIVETAVTKEKCCGGCSGEIDEWKVVRKESCDDGEVCREVTEKNGGVFAKCKGNFEGSTTETRPVIPTAATNETGGGGK
ncbi:hypothetical protein HYV89_04845 [Candidatus Woesearchaeota archaeon]|nr:hypothetical protein [Candidatus Woesearchaeota archaeon]